MPYGVRCDPTDDAIVVNIIHTVSQLYPGLQSPGSVIRRTGGSPPWYVYPPNFIERLFGITFERKIERAVARARRYAERLNARAEKVRRVYESIIRSYPVDR